MEAKIFRHKQQQREKEEEFMNEEHHEQAASYNPTPPTQQEEHKKPEPPPKADPLQGLSEEEAFNYISSLPETATSASGPATEFHMNLKQLQVKMKLRKKEPEALTDEQIVQIKKKVHKYRVAHALEMGTQEDIDEQNKQVSSGT
jgi:hypothetical protein